VAIAFVGTGAYVAGNATSVTLNAPTGIATGNCVIAFVTVQDDGGMSTVNTPTGWVKAFGPQVGLSQGGSYAVFYAFIAIHSAGLTYVFNGQDNGAVIAAFDGHTRGYSNTASSSIVNYAAGAQASGGSIVIGTFSGHETFTSGEWYVTCKSDPSNDTGASASPTLSNTYSNSGTFQSYESGDYVPGSVPGAETWSGGSTGVGAVAIGLTILPPAGGGVAQPWTLIPKLGPILAQ